MGLFSIIKRNSRLALKGNWGRAIVILLILVGVSFLVTAFTQTAVSIFSPLPVFDDSGKLDRYQDIAQLAGAYHLSAAEWIIFASSTVLSLLLVTPLSLGAARWYYSLVHGKSLPVTELFCYFERGRLYARAILYEISIGIRSLLWMVLFYLLPSAILGIALFFLSGNEELSRTGMMTATLGVFLSAALFLLMTLFYAACLCRYTLVPYLLAEDADLTVGQAIKQSVRYTKGYRFSLLWFVLSYTGWFLLLIFFWPMLYVTPYYSTGIAMYARFIIEKNRAVPAEATQEFAAETMSEAVPEPAGGEPLTENTENKSSF